MSEFVLPSHEGKSVWLGGVGVDFKIAGEQTGGLFSIVEHPIDPGLWCHHTCTPVRTSSRMCSKVRSGRE